jgi:hypothetical protein
MGVTTRYGLLVVVLALGLGACASDEQWREWKAHSTHFASVDHLTFSMRNRGPEPRVRRRDERAALAQSWWGQPVIVRPDQIFED